MIILSLFLYLIAAILLLVILVPYKYAAIGKKIEETYFKASVSWLFGAIKLFYYRSIPGRPEVYIKLFGLKKKISKAEKSIKPEKPANKVVPKPRRKNFKQYLSIEFVKGTFKAVIKTLKYIAPKRLYIRVKVGFEDPAITGMVYGLKSITGSFMDKHDILINPVFDEEVIEGRFLMGGKVWLPNLILVLIGIIFSKPFRNIVINSIAEQSLKIRQARCLTDFIAKLQLKFKGGKLNVN